MELQESTNRLVELIRHSQSPYHTMKEAISQLEKAGCPERAEMPFQKAILNDELPYTIGGGIGQSRICMFFLRKAHIGEVQCSLWPEGVSAEAEKNGMMLL